jgi:hypothetical protein
MEPPVDVANAEYPGAWFSENIDWTYRAILWEVMALAERLSAKDSEIERLKVDARDSIRQRDDAIRERDEWSERAALFENAQRLANQNGALTRVWRMMDGSTLTTQGAGSPGNYSEALFTAQPDCVRPGGPAFQHEVAWLRDLLAEERKRADKAESERDKAVGDAARFCRDRNRAREGHQEAADLAELRLAEILRLRAEREEIRSRGWTDEILMETLVVRPSPFLFRNSEWPAGASPGDAEPKPEEQPKPEAITAGSILAILLSATRSTDIEILCRVEVAEGHPCATMEAFLYGGSPRASVTVDRTGPPALIRLRAEGLVKELREAMAKSERRLAPWPDFAGNPIYEGDTIRHQSGQTGVVVVDGTVYPANRWRVRYPDGSDHWLGHQINDKGMAVVVPNLSGGR